MRTSLAARLPRPSPVVLIAVGVVLALAGVGLAVGFQAETVPAAAPPEVGGAHPQPPSAEPTEDVTFTGFGELELAGTVDLPAEDGEHAGVVIVPGFGPTTRDGIARSDGQVDALYADLAALLSRAGMVVLRYDKRGTGASVPLPDDPPLEFAHHVADAAGAVRYLRHRDDVDGDRIVVIGHDQGGLAALHMVADGGGEPGAVVLIATPGRPLVEVFAGEIREGALHGDEAQRAAWVAELEAYAAALLAGKEPPALSEALRRALPADGAAFTRSLFALAPAELAARVDVPTLIVQGGNDPGLTESDVAALESALAGPVDVVRAPSAGHTLELLEGRSHQQAMGGGAPAVRDEHALADIVVWLETTLSRPRTSACAHTGHLATEGGGTRYDRPGGTPQSIRASGAGGVMPADYAFLFADASADCAPARFDPCQPVHYVVNDTSAPAGGLELVHEAFVRLGDATGIEFAYDGTSTRLFDSRPAVPGTGPAPPVVVSWEHRGAGEDGRVVPGFGHPVLVGNEIVTGAVALNVDAVTDLNTRTPLAVGFGRGVTWGRVLLHELAHVVGLGHVSDPAQLMYAELSEHTSPTAEFGAGDLEGLRLVGREAGCLS